MPDSLDSSSESYLPYLYRRHPWHGVSIGDDAPGKVTAFIEIVPTDTVKYEIDKHSGLLKIDRPQKFSNVYPSLYGFIPQTYCGKETGTFCSQHVGRPAIDGDGDPLDICVLTESTIPHGDILVRAVPIGGLRMIDGNQADDKIIAVLEGDPIYGGWTELEHAPTAVIERLRHYFLTYKQIPGEEPIKVEIPQVYGRAEALEVISCTMRDYDRDFAHVKAAKEALPGRL